MRDHESDPVLPYGAEGVEGTGGEEVERAELAEGAPAGAIGREDEVLVVVGEVLGAGGRRAVAKVGVVRAEEAAGDLGRRCDDDLDAAEAEAEEGAMLARESGHGVMRHGP